MSLNATHEYVMDSVPKLDTFEGEAFHSSKSARNSYSSTTDSNPRSARSSYASISDINSVSARTSYSSIPEYLNRVSSFSRTSDSFIPDSTESSPIDSRDPSLESPTRWVRQEVKMADQTSSSILSKERPRSHSKSGSKDGPSALKELQNVRNVMCVAFGAFDRYYISWEDNDGEFHQESHKLPESLYKWLFPPSGETRHLPTLQVSFGSNDDFFASDQDGKLSSRDANLPAEKKAPPPRLADVARGFMRRKAHTVSSPRMPDNLQSKLEEGLVSPKLERRRTFLEGQASPRADPKQTAVPLSLSLHTRRDSRGENSSKELTSIPLSLSLHSRKESRVEMPKIEEKTPFVPVPDQFPPLLDATTELAKAEYKRSMFTTMERQMPPPELKEERIVVEESRNIIPLNQPQLTRLDAKPELVKMEQRRSLLAGVQPFRPSWPERKTLVINRERLLTSREVVVRKPAYIDACIQTEITDTQICEHLSSIYVPITMPSIPLPPRHSVAIGSMTDFFRGQYSLGDALRFV